MPQERAQVISAAYLVLEEDGQRLFLRRRNTSFYEGHYAFVAGHVESGETPRMAMQREAREEANISVNTDDLELVHIMYDAPSERVHFFFRPLRWQGPVRNNEPHKADVLDWFARGADPQPLIPFVDRTLRRIDEGVWESEDTTAE